MHCYARAALDTGNDLYRALMQLSDAKDQGQSQSSAIRGATLLQPAEEPVKCTSLAFLGKSGAVVANRDGHAFLIMRDIDYNTRAREAQRIIE